MLVVSLHVWCDAHTMNPLSVLVVGAGAVGQVYARHLMLGGAKVTLFVRERHREEALRGFDLVRVRGLGRARAADRSRRELVRLEGCEVVTTAEEVAARSFDQVYLTVSSTGLRGPWLAEIVKAIGDATLVGLTPSPGDRALLFAAGVKPENLVDGLISLVSYHSPLDGEDEGTPPGTTYWFPPAAPCLLSGSSRAEDVVMALERGGLPARRHPDVPRMAAFPNAAFMVHLMALEAVGWSFANLVRSQAMTRAVRGAREAIAVTEVSVGKAPMALTLLATRGALLRVALWVMVRIAPFPLETYVRTHFTKVGGQTRLIVDSLIERGRAAGLPVDTLVTLRAECAEEEGSRS